MIRHALSSEFSLPSFEPAKFGGRFLAERSLQTSSDGNCQVIGCKAAAPNLAAMDVWAAWGLAAAMLSRADKTRHSCFAGECAIGCLQPGLGSELIGWYYIDAQRISISGCLFSLQSGNHAHLHVSFPW